MRKSEVRFVLESVLPDYVPDDTVDELTDAILDELISQCDDIINDEQTYSEQDET